MLFVNTPVTCCSQMVVFSMHNGELRQTVDMQALNKGSVRQTHQTKIPFKASAVSSGKIKSVLDVWNSNSYSNIQCLVWPQMSL